MSLLPEYGLTPNVFITSSYATEDIADICQGAVRNALLNDGIVRDFHDGSWSSHLKKRVGEMHPRWKELFKKLARSTSSRLVKSPAQSPAVPVDDCGWCNEAVLSDIHEPMTGIVVNDPVPTAHERNPRVKSISAACSSAWWSGSIASAQVARTRMGYEEALKPFLMHANLLKIIDPYFGPDEPRYQDFIDLLEIPALRSVPPTIEIHREVCDGSLAHRSVKSGEDWRNSFDSGLVGKLRKWKLKVEVRIWDELHDRHIITNLGGLHLGNSLDTTKKRGDTTTWSRISRFDNVDLDRKFDTSVNTPIHAFSVG